MLNFLITNQLTKKFLQTILRKVINSPEIEFRYISLHLQIITKDNDIIDFGNMFIVDRLNQKSIKGCLFYFNIVYNSDILNNNELEISQVIVNYKEVKRSEYITHLNNFYNDKT